MNIIKNPKPKPKPKPKPQIVLYPPHPDLCDDFEAYWKGLCDGVLTEIPRGIKPFGPFQTYDETYDARNEAKQRYNHLKQIIGVCSNDFKRCLPILKEFMYLSLGIGDDPVYTSLTFFNSIENHHKWLVDEKKRFPEMNRKMRVLQKALPPSNEPITKEELFKITESIGVCFPPSYDKRRCWDLLKENNRYYKNFQHSSYYGISHYFALRSFYLSLLLEKKYILGDYRSYQADVRNHQSIVKEIKQQQRHAIQFKANQLPEDIILHKIMPFIDYTI